MSAVVPYPTLETERLILRPFELSDAPRVQALASAPEIAEMTLNIPHPYPEGAAEQWIASHPAAFAEGRSVSFAMVLRDSGELCGAIGLMFDTAHRHAEMGYWLGLPYWGRGYTTEAAVAVLHYGFEERGLIRIFATHYTKNPASGRVMQKIGMVQEGVLRRHVIKWNVAQDLVMYGILAEEFRG